MAEMRGNLPEHLLVVGAGALANALLPRVVRMGWKAITLMDGDRVEARNLERQELFAPVDVGKPKVNVLAAWLRNAPLAIRIHARDEFLGAENAEEAIAAHDAVADCTDDIHVKGLLDRTCAMLAKPLVSGSVHGRQAQVILLHAAGPGSGLSRPHLFQGRPGVAQDGCDMRNVPLATIDEAGRKMAGQLKALVGGAPVANGRIELFDGAQWMMIDAPVH